MTGTTKKLLVAAAMLLATCTARGAAAPPDTVAATPLDTIALGEWSHIRAEIAGDEGAFFVDGVEVLRVNGFKHGANARGSVGLYVDIGTDGYFRNLHVQADD